MALLTLSLFPWNGLRMPMQNIEGFLTYNRAMGRFFWANHENRRDLVSKMAGGLHPSGYRFVKVNQKSYAEHRLVWFFEKGEWPSRDLDHIDGDRSNNKIENLREVNDSQNSMNAKGKGGSSKFKGVCWNKRAKKWVVQISIEGKQKEVHRGKSELEAALIYNLFAQKHYKEFAKYNQVFEDMPHE